MDFESIVLCTMSFSCLLLAKSNIFQVYWSVYFVILSVCLPVNRLLVTILNQLSDAILKTERYVLDGGSLLHKLKWRRGDTSGKIAKAYANFSSEHYGAVTAVFDRYGGRSLDKG